MKKQAILIMVILAFVVFASGCTDTSDNSTSSKNTFSQEGISFEYPSSWGDFQKLGGSGTDQLKNLGYINGADNVDVQVQKTNLALVPPGTVEYVKNSSVEYYKDYYNATVLNDTKTSVNGLDHYEVILSTNTPAYKEKHYIVVMGKDNEVGYSIDFSAPVSRFNKQLPIFKSVEQTISIQ